MKEHEVREQYRLAMMRLADNKNPWLVRDLEIKVQQYEALINGRLWEKEERFTIVLTTTIVVEKEATNLTLSDLAAHGLTADQVIEALRIPLGEQRVVLGREVLRNSLVRAATAVLGARLSERDPTVHLVGADTTKLVVRRTG